MWWHRCDSLKCLLCLWKGLWTNECELLATPPYKRCICVRQRKGPTSVMGGWGLCLWNVVSWWKGWSWTNAVSLFGKPHLLVTNRHVYPGATYADAPPALRSMFSGYRVVFISLGEVKMCSSGYRFGFPLCVFVCLSICELISVATPSLFSPVSLFQLCNWSD